jgi:hypothetical protein
MYLSGIIRQAGVSNGQSVAASAAPHESTKITANKILTIGTSPSVACRNPFAIRVSKKSGSVAPITLAAAGIDKNLAHRARTPERSEVQAPAGP